MSAANIETRHGRACRSHSGGRCNCEPSYRAKVRVDGKRVPYSSRSRAEVESWLRDARIARKRGQGVEGKSVDTLRVVAEQFLAHARSGVVGARGGDSFKPATIRSYAAALRLRVYPTLGDEPVADIRRNDLQDLVDALKAKGLAPATIQGAITPLKKIFRREVARGRLTVNPTADLELPGVRSGRERIASPTEGAQLLAAVPENDRAIWATAMYAGLRRGEIRALHVDRIDFDAGLIHVERGWDDREGEQETKGRNRRKVPISNALRGYLLAHLMRTGRRDRDLAFGRTATLPFDPHRVSDRADTAWTDAKLARITLHECRHTFASLMIAAGVNAKAICDYMGHSSIQVTYDKYGHLMPGNENQAAGLLDAYLDAAGGAGA